MIRSRADWKLVTLGSVVIAFSGAAVAPSVWAQPKAATQKGPSEKHRAELLAQMKGVAQTTEVTIKGSSVKPELISTPVFRYDDQPRRFIDATMWVWTVGGRPVAVEKIEAMFHGDTDIPTWGYCFTSVSSELISAKWQNASPFDAKEAAPPFRVVTGAPAVAERDIGKKRQARELARKFEVRILIDPLANVTADMRLLTSPIYEYSDPKTGKFLGAIYGFSSNGTNPDFLLSFEPQERNGKTEWYFAPVRMTSGGLTVKLQGKEVWQAPYAHGGQAPFPTWTFFQTRRMPLNVAVSPAE